MWSEASVVSVFFLFLLQKCSRGFYCEGKKKLLDTETCKTWQAPIHTRERSQIHTSGCISIALASRCMDTHSLPRARTVLHEYTYIPLEGGNPKT